MNHRANLKFKVALVVHVLILACVVSARAQSSKVALIVAISDYADPGELPSVTSKTKGFPDLNSMNDVPLIKTALLSQGFNEKDILVIEDGSATKNGIVGAIQDHLIEKSTSGGIAVFHYSGHGQQVLDNDEDEIDGLDEALVPYDAAPVWQPGVNEAQNHLRDDELGELMNELRLKLGDSGHLLAILDACSSGTATRGFATSRGYKEPLVPDGTVKKVEVRDAVGRGLTIEKKMVNSSIEKEIAPFVLISAAQADQLNYETRDDEGKSIGSLSFAFSKAMAQSGGGTSYEDLFNRILVEMASLAPNQTPSIEGAVDQLVLKGEAKSGKEHFSVKAYENELRLVIGGGRLFSLLNGAKVELYPIGADTAKSEPLTTGTVMRAENLESWIELSSALSKNEALNCYAYVTQRSFGDLGVRVRFDIDEKPRFRSRIEKAIAEIDMVKVVQKSPDLVVELNNQYARRRGPNRLVVTSAQDYVLFDKEIGKDSIQQVVDDVIQHAVLASARAKYLRGLNVGNGKSTVSLKFKPVGSSDEAGTSNPKLNLGDKFKLELTNNGTQKVYVALLDIMPDNQIGVMIPHPGEGKTASDYLIRPGQTIEVKTPYEVAPPVGRDVLKLIVTEGPVDFTNLIRSNGAMFRGANLNPDPLANLIAFSYQTDGTKTRGAIAPKASSSGGSISTFTFEIKEADRK